MHAPLQATEKYLNRFKQIEDPKRRSYAALQSAMDDAIGTVLAKLPGGDAQKALKMFSEQARLEVLYGQTYHLPHHRSPAVHPLNHVRVLSRQLGAAARAAPIYFSSIFDVMQTRTASVLREVLKSFLRFDVV